MTSQLKLQLQSPGIYRVLNDSGLHVGNLKQIGGIWKFKAIGYDGSGQVIPGGGLLTDRHNTVFTTLDEVEASRSLLINKALDQ
jgi:hypothetical protein